MQERLYILPAAKGVPRFGLIFSRILFPDIRKGTLNIRSLSITRSVIADSLPLIHPRITQSRERRLTR